MVLMYDVIDVVSIIGIMSAVDVDDVGVDVVFVGCGGVVLIVGEGGYCIGGVVVCDVDVIDVVIVVDYVVGVAVVGVDVVVWDDDVECCVVVAVMLRVWVVVVVDCDVLTGADVVMVW